MDIKIKENNIKFKVRVSCVMIINNKLLVNKYTQDSYCLPGGYVELGETSLEAAKREMKEELNVEVNVERIMGICENFYTNLRNEKTHGIDFYCKVVPKNIEKVNLNDYERLEIDHGHEILHHFKWLEIDKLEKNNLLPNEVIKYIKSDKDNVFYTIIQSGDNDEK